MKSIRTILLSLIVALPLHLNAQMFHNLEFSGGWAHVSGNNGLDGFTGGAALWFNNRVSIAFDFDHARDDNALTTFALQSNTGLITVKNRMEDYLIGPRFFFHSKNVQVLHTL